ncbi:uncharacterized protein LOC120360011 [Solenopsis invicta]|uniref:uncharacterized protein LOC113004478 n=1 Tax=Solenopsis invicta TaxID=13686 RepID=UPI000E33D49F|nr:uncharacterized protein LOC113004478 [Solenopsis invicta]XP_039315450.1 uncharacterized protein LOC120360011 [Solenopsis invicta]
MFSVPKANRKSVKVTPYADEPISHSSAVKKSLPDRLSRLAKDLTGTSGKTLIDVNNAGEKTGDVESVQPPLGSLPADSPVAGITRGQFNNDGTRPAASGRYTETEDSPKAVP